MTIIDQLTQLETHLQELTLKCRHLEQENRSLLETKQFLQAQCEDLGKKRDIAKKKVEQILSQLTKMEASND